MALLIIGSIFIFSPSLSSSSFVFTSFSNSTGFSSDGDLGKLYVCVIGILSSAYAFAGYEGAATLAEETLSPSYVAPRGVFYTCLVSFLVGLLALLGILYGCQENIDYLLNGPGDTSENLFTLVYNHSATAIGFATLLLAVAVFLTGFSSITVLSRMAYSMARDGAFPWFHYLRELDPQTKAPTRIVFMLLAVSSTLTLLPLLSTTAYTAITQISTVCTQVSYLVPIYLRITAAKTKFKQHTGFNLGRYSLLLGRLSFLWLAVSTIIILLPTQVDPVRGITWENFNYTPVILTAFLATALSFWHMGAKHHY